VLIYSQQKSRQSFDYQNRCLTNPDKYLVIVEVLRIFVLVLILVEGDKFSRHEKFVKLQSPDKREVFVSFNQFDIIVSCDWSFIMGQGSFWSKDYSNI
jgi:hypothetical protein